MAKDSEVQNREHATKPLFWDKVVLSVRGITANEDKPGILLSSRI